MSAAISPADAAGAASHARAALAVNRRTGTDRGLAYDFTCPSPDSYPFQWAWDSSYHAIALSRTDPARAAAEIDTLLHGVASDGFLPHMLLWQENLRSRATEDFRIALWNGWTSITLAPPVLARAVERVHEASGDPAWLASALPGATAFFDWLHLHRAEPDGLLTIHQPDESGLDSSSKYDQALGIAETPTAEISPRWHQAMRNLLERYAPGRRPDSAPAGADAFRWVDVLFNTVYADGLAALSRLLTAVRPGDPAAAVYAERSRQVAEALVARCWDDEEGVFWDIDLRTGEQQKVRTVSSLFPILLDAVPDRLAQRVIDEHLLNPGRFWLTHPVPSVAADEPTFDPHFETGAIFRGSSWVNLNWYLHGGLRSRGRYESARELACRTVRMTARSGMRECYDPLTGAGQGATSFGWSSLVLDLMAAEDMTAQARA
ncbi:MGH1-like glycoside hydrolase domain-containing protein [Actinacidiphila rubida]|uniref:Glycosyl hydrolase family 63 C-terminal domain-containing protein n=1 Tax=Actinacidiphila rubida TaxID=310780 RepID=A0A1H8V0D7_9ACTN|nr:trehalase family glycosidase [Actinacidiphila rubida]SEP08268.1 Glycosyl hydrolase family 63 C-terminal domain-containing protein [Actinacidiphila rubida]